MKAGGLRGLARWLTAGWRQAAFSVLAVYAVAAVIFLAFGGASPESSSMEVMEEEVIAAAEEDDISNSNNFTNSSSGDGEINNAAPDGSADATATSAAQPGSCHEIDPTASEASSTSGNGEINNVRSVSFQTLDEELANLSAYEGCPLIVNFFASWCVPCVTEMPEFEQFWQMHGSQVAVVGIAVEEAEPARSIVAETGVTYLAGVDESDLLVRFGGLAMPTTVFVSANGDRLNTHSGILTFDDLVTRSADLFGLDDYFEGATQ